jgi:hypothetical protein
VLNRATFGRVGCRRLLHAESRTSMYPNWAKPEENGRGLHHQPRCDGGVMECHGTLTAAMTQPGAGVEERRLRTRRNAHRASPHLSSIPFILSPTANVRSLSILADLAMTPPATYPHTTFKFSMCHTPRARQKELGRTVRRHVILSIHKLTAGSGYDYLTGQVATLDATESYRISVLLHTELGERPGVDRLQRKWHQRPDCRRPGDSQAEASTVCLCPISAAERRWQQLEGPSLTQSEHQDATRARGAVQDP